MSDNENAVRLQKFLMDFIDKAGESKQYLVESRDGEGLSEIVLPFNFNKFDADEITVRFYSKLDSFEETTDFEFFKFLVVGDKYSGDDKKAFERRKHASSLYRNLSKDYFKQAEDEDQSFPDMNYSDITEKDMFGYPAIPSSNLYSDEGGLWGWHGFRKFEIKVTGLAEETSSDLEQKINLYWDHIDATEIDESIFEDKILSVKKDEGAKDKKYIAYINTNNLGDALTQNIESRHPRFTGRFEIHNIYTDMKMVYTFPITVCVHDTRLLKGKNELMDVNAVSIDFGTSSTCAAIKSKGKNRLLTLSGVHKRISAGDNAYENPTNLMIYRWDEIYDQWRRENENCPFFLTTRKDNDYFNDKAAEYDSGYTVEDELGDLEDDKIAKNKMQAILTQLKMIPQFIKEGKEIKFTPFKGRNRVPVMVTDSIDENTIKKFNPVAFYGYLLSRAINNPANGKFYRNYKITYPVKFDKGVRENIRKSLEYGIKRALPACVRDAVDKKGNPIVSVKMDYPESIACVGAIVGKQLVISNEDNGAKLFAIYDIGGGTVDFAYGMFRPSITEEEQELSDQVIEVFGVEGENDAGGEILIHKLAYKIYLDNRALMEEARIKFVIPPEELNPQGFEGLLSPRGDYIADGNVNILKEKLARPLFIYHGDQTVNDSLTNIFPTSASDSDAKAPDAGHVTLPLLIDELGESKTDFNVAVSGVDEFIEAQIFRTVKAFKDRMIQIFGNNIEHMRNAGINDFNIDDVYIFLGGNASKQHFVREKMNELFSVNNSREHIQRIGEGSNVEGESDEYLVNEKTAVAFGQLDIGSYGYVARMTISDEDEADGMPPFLYNVGYKDPGTGKFTLVIEKGSKREWKKANRIDVQSMTTNLYYTTSMTCEEKSLIPLAEDISDFVDEDDKKRRTLFIRINKENSIEFRIGALKEIPDDNEEPDEDMVLQLK